MTSIPLVPFDIAKANELLDKDGWTRGPDGIRQKNGARLALDFATTAGAPDADEQIELIRATWKQIGVDITVRHYPPALMFAPLQQGGIVYSNKWDVIVFAWLNDAIGDMSPLYSCHSIPPNGQNNLHWCNQRAQGAMDALFGHFDQIAAKRRRADRGAGVDEGRAHDRHVVTRRHLRLQQRPEELPPQLAHAVRQRHGRRYIA